jgi:hypothetical protein
MKDWRIQLNRLTIEFWCGIGDLSELPSWADAANQEMGEVHPDVWDLYVIKSTEAAEGLLLKIAKDINKFQPASWEAEPFAVMALKRALELFLSKQISVQTLCQVVSVLDSMFVIGLVSVERPREHLPKSLEKIAWLGNLYNCCDWCDDSWSFDNSQHLIVEARRLLTVLPNRVAGSF